MSEENNTMTGVQLATLLNRIATDVKENHALHGIIEYKLIDGSYSVNADLRSENTAEQGSNILIGHVGDGFHPVCVHIEYPPSEKNRYCMVPVIDSNGAPDIFFCIVACSKPEQYEVEDGGDYAYELEAIKLAEAEGYEVLVRHAIVYTQEDPAGKKLLSSFLWSTATVVNI